jgi:hypothetical protein
MTFMSVAGLFTGGAFYYHTDLSHLSKEEFGRQALALSIEALEWTALNRANASIAVRYEDEWWPTVRRYVEECSRRGR